MRNGSLVECLKDIVLLPPAIVCNRPLPKKGDIEVVENITGTGHLILEGFRFETTGNVDFTILYVGFDPKHWRELQPPMELSFIEEMQCAEVA